MLQRHWLDTTEKDAPIETWSQDAPRQYRNHRVLLIKVRKWLLIHRRKAEAHSLIRMQASVSKIIFIG